MTSDGPLPKDDQRSRQDFGTFDGDGDGHADERGSREYNLALGEGRAKAVKQQMLLLGATSNQIRLVSYGEERPASDGHDDVSWQQNRRVEILY